MSSILHIIPELSLEDYSESYLNNIEKWLNQNILLWLRENNVDDEELPKIQQRWQRDISAQLLIRATSIEDIEQLHLTEKPETRLLLLNCVKNLRENFENKRRTEYSESQKCDSSQVDDIHPKPKYLDTYREGSILFENFEVSPFGIEPISTSMVSRSNSLRSSPTFYKNTKDGTVLVQLIGKGGSSQVMKGLYVPTLTIVAVKIVRVGSPSIRKQMLSEIRALYAMSRHSFTAYSPSKISPIESRRPSPTYASHLQIPMKNFHELLNKKILEQENTLEQVPEENTLKVAQSLKLSIPISVIICLGFCICYRHHVTTERVILLFFLLLFMGFYDNIASFLLNDDDVIFQLLDETNEHEENNPSKPTNPSENYADAFSEDEDIVPDSSDIELEPSEHSDMRCPYIVKFYDAYTDPDQRTVSIVLEHMDGGSFQNLIDANVKVDEDDIAVVAYSIVKALLELHNRHIIHRDIKPGNILYDHHGFVKLSDFGIVREMSDQMISTDTFTGTVHYMSPERINGGKYSFKSDIWSVGITLLAMMQAASPFAKVEGYWGLVDAIQSDQTQNLGSKLSSNLFDFIKCCLHNDPIQRLSAAELLNHPFITDAIERKIILPPYQPRLINMRVEPVKESKIKELIDKIIDWHVSHLDDTRCVSIVTELLDEYKLHKDGILNQYEEKDGLKRLFRLWYPHYCNRSNIRWLAQQIQSDSNILESYMRLKVSIVNKVLSQLLMILKCKAYTKRIETPKSINETEILASLQSVFESVDISAMIMKKLTNIAQSIIIVLNTDISLSIRKVSSGPKIEIPQYDQFKSNMNSSSGSECNSSLLSSISTPKFTDALANKGLFADDSDDFRNKFQPIDPQIATKLKVSKTTEVPTCSLSNISENLKIDVSLLENNSSKDAIRFCGKVQSDRNKRKKTNAPDDYITPSTVRPLAKTTISPSMTSKQSHLHRVKCFHSLADTCDEKLLNEFRRESNLDQNDDKVRQQQANNLSILLMSRSEEAPSE